MEKSMTIEHSGHHHDIGHGHGDHHDRHATTTIIVNGREKTVTSKELTFAQVVALAFSPPPSGENIVFTVTYRKGPHPRPEGTMTEGQSVKIKEGMIFNVTATDKS
jgi:hypothetical protein